MSASTPLGQPVLRIDAYSKAAGVHRYPSDIVLDDMLWVQVLRAAYPHARLRSIDPTAATALPGVVCVLTARDVPGLNRFGLAIPDAPVLCEDRVRYSGDAVAIVAAETDDIAHQARELIRVEYEPLPVLTDPYQAMQPTAPPLHPGGNICAEFHVGHGQIAAGFAEADFVIERTYQTGRQEHAFLETEAGVAYYDEAGQLTVCVGGQNPFTDLVQISRSLNLPETEIRVLQPMMGGAFGGKEDIALPIHLALVTYHTKRPCRLRLDRDESIISGTKRHPFHVRFKTGVKKDGRLTAAEVSIVADTGAYASWGPDVTAMATDHCCGPYYFPHTKIDSYTVYTNNSVSGAFRGFGNPQMMVCLEQQMEIMAEAIGMDPIAFRRLNTLQSGQVAGAGYQVIGPVSLPRVLAAAEQGELYTRRAELKALPAGASPWKRRGVGLAAARKGLGHGAGTNDGAAVKVELQADGRYRLHASCPDLGQGTATTLMQIVAHELNCTMSDIDVTLGDTLSPNSGSSNASRTTSMVGSAIGQAAIELRQKIIAAVKRMELGQAAPHLAGREVHVNGQRVSLAELVAEIGPLVGQGYFQPELPELVTAGVPCFSYSYCVQVALVEVDLLTGEIEVLRLENFLDAGRIINPAGVEAQAEGGIIQGLGYALFEDILLEEGRFLNPRLSNYIIPSICDIPGEIKTILLEEPEPLSLYRTRGVAEIVLSPTAPAILNAISNAIGVRFERIPVTPEMVLAALAERGGAV